MDRKSILILLAILLLLGLAFGCSSANTFSSLLGIGGNEVQVTINSDLIDEADRMDIDYVDLRFYRSTDDGRELVRTERLDMTERQSFRVDGLTEGSISITAVLPDGDSTDVRTTGDGHIASGDVLVVVFPDSENPYWSVA
jgi:hypothetical protein